MSSFNKVMLHGRLTSDPELRKSENGRAVTTFSLATSLNWKNRDGEKVSKTDFHRIVAFGRLGEIVGQYLKKGLPVLVAGRLSNHSYVAKDGGKRYMTEIVMDDFNFLSKAKAKESEGKVAVAA